MKLSTQFVGCIMMALQKGLIEQCDISQLLLDFEVEEDPELGLVVLNPPSFQVDSKEEKEE